MTNRDPHALFYLQRNISITEKIMFITHEIKDKNANSTWSKDKQIPSCTSLSRMEENCSWHSAFFLHGREILCFLAHLRSVWGWDQKSGWRINLGGAASPHRVLLGFDLFFFWTKGLLLVEGGVTIMGRLGFLIVPGGSFLVGQLNRESCGFKHRRLQ